MGLTSGSAAHYSIVSHEAQGRRHTDHQPLSRRTWSGISLVIASVIALTAVARWPRGDSEVRASYAARPAQLGAAHSMRTPSEPCNRTLLLDWDSWGVGVGSCIATLLQAAVWAESHGYQVLVSRGKNNYGAHEFYFDPPELSCVPAESAYGIADCRNGSPSCPFIYNASTGEYLHADLPSQTALGVWTLYPVNPANRWVADTLFDFKSLEGLPPYSSAAPLPLVLSRPPALEPAFQRMHSAFKRYFGLNADMRAIVYEKAKMLELDRSPEDRVPVIGVHYRGGDKLIYECEATAKMSCANVTLHVEAAVQHLKLVTAQAKYKEGKPKLVLLTAEADIFNNFSRVNENEFGNLFEIVKAPESTVSGDTGGSFRQGSFNSLPLDTRVANTKDLFGNLAMLARHADGFAVSANTNLGRIAMLFSDRAHAVSNLDFWWHPTLYLLEYPKCKGLGHCIPN